MVSRNHNHGPYCDTATMPRALLRDRAGMRPARVEEKANEGRGRTQQHMNFIYFFSFESGMQKNIIVVKKWEFTSFSPLWTTNGSK